MIGFLHFKLPLRKKSAKTGSGKRFKKYLFFSYSNVRKVLSNVKSSKLIQVIERLKYRKKKRKNKSKQHKQTAIKRKTLFFSTSRFTLFFIKLSKGKNRKSNERKIISHFLIRVFNFSPFLALLHVTRLWQIPQCHQNASKG